MKKLTFLFLFVSFTCLGQNNKTTFKDATGKVVEEGYYTNDGKRVSLWVRYNENGSVIATASFNDGVKNGVWETFSDNGLKLFELVYLNGKMVSGKRWDENGVLIETK
jgi:antitoxin component YwqK of YwqJK toxin-antitoxin module